MILETIASPADVKALSTAQLRTLADEMRQALLARLSSRGGHCGPNFGMVEATIALHYVFDSPIDKIVFDVSHQCYAHKMLTGRQASYTDPAKYGDVTGYTEPRESEHDHFTVGHTSTSVSLASGLAKGRDLQGLGGNVIAVIGDGSLSGGEALEGLDYAAELGTNFIVVVNDNQMSIAENHGGIYANLALLRQTHGEASCNLFRAMGLDYLYVEDGNDVEALIAAFSKVKDINHPIVVHINTLKGKGFAPAERHKEAWHYCGKFDPEAELAKLAAEDAGTLSDDTAVVDAYPDLTAEYLLSRMAVDKSVVAISAGTPAVIGFTEPRRLRAGKQFVDVGIAEEHAVALASGIAKAGGKPVFGVVSSFIQRAYDQLSQDLCINNNPALLLVYMASMSSMTDVTHLCWFDIPLMSNIPNLVYLSPASRQEYFAMLDWAMQYREHPVAIRVPLWGGMVEADYEVEKDYGELNRYQITRQGKRVAIIGLGSFHTLAHQAADELGRAGIDATVINPRYITGVDAELLDGLRRDHELVITLEDGAIDGGFGEMIARHYGATEMKVLCRGAEKHFEDHYSPADFMQKCRLTPELIAKDVFAQLG